jgi:hypothetical protein
MANLGANVFTAHTPITLGRLRNGPAADVARTARDSSVAPKYYFSGARYDTDLGGNETTRIPHCPPVVLFECQWRSAFSAIVEASVADANAAHNAATAAPGGAGAAAFDEAAARAAAAGLPSNRLEAIAIGAVHTTLVASYSVTDAELRPVESNNALLALVSPAGAADTPAYAALLRTATSGWIVQLASGHTGGDITGQEQVMLDAAPLTADEVELAFALMAMAQAAPVRAGAQLYEDGHHYHSDAEGSARHKAIEREVMGRVSGPVRNVWRANLMMFRNAVWHAGVHPVAENFLQTMAEDNDMPDRLDATGYGSMSVGLPAQEDLFRRAGSYLACHKQVAQTAKAHGHEVSLAQVEAAVRALGGIPRRGALPAQRPELPGMPAAGWPVGCDTRAKALKLFLQPFLDSAEPVAAWLFSYYKEICSRAGIRANSQEGSLLRSYSLKRALANYLGEANRASEMFAARARFVRSEGEKGKLENYKGEA